MEQPTNHKMLMLAAWSGPAMAVIFLLGWVVAAHFIPPTAPADSAEQIRAFYMNNLTGIRIGMILCAIGAVLLVPFGAVVAVLLRRTGGGLPVLTYTQLVCSAMSTVFIVLTATAYGVAAFRPDEAPAFVTVGFNDLGSSSPQFGRRSASGTSPLPSPSSATKATCRCTHAGLPTPTSCWPSATLLQAS